MLRPSYLKTGDCIGVISLASSPRKEEIQRAVLYLNEQGFKVKLGTYYDRKNGYLAGTDEERVKDLHEMFLDKNIKAVFCTRGGFGSGRLSEKINLEIIRQNPKIFMGYSDITYIHSLFNERCQLVTFHGPMLQPEFSQECIDESTIYSLDVLQGKREWEIPMKQTKTIVSGLAEGNLIGGNLTVFMSMFGTEDEPNLDGKIVFFEDIKEDPYKIDRMLNQFYLSRKWKNVRGFILGSFTECEPTGNHGIFVEEVLEHYFKKMNKPTIAELPIGHSIPNYMIPLNCPISMNTWTKKISMKDYLQL